jgi:general secretion pathway protein M
MHATLPTGRAGQWAALGLAVVALLVLWAAVAAPLASWYGDRAEALAGRGALAARMAGLAAELPALERAATQAADAGPPAGAMLDQPSDAVAGAALQQRVQDIATKAGATLSSAEALAAEAAGGYRRIRLRVSLTARWPVLVAVLQALAGQTAPQMLVDDVQLRSAPVLLDRDDPPLDASFTVVALRAGTEPAAAR